MNRRGLLLLRFLGLLLSIPYWDFLVLNQKEAHNMHGLPEEAFNSLLGFSSFESDTYTVELSFHVFSFNSLLGFSSFESLMVFLIGKKKFYMSFNSLLGFSSFES